jgi:hypothetical protein
MNDKFEKYFDQYAIDPKSFEVACGKELCRAVFLFDTQQGLDTLLQIPQDPAREIVIGDPIVKANGVNLTVYFNAKPRDLTEAQDSGIAPN